MESIQSRTLNSCVWRGLRIVNHPVPLSMLQRCRKPQGQLPAAPTAGPGYLAFSQISLGRSRSMYLSTMRSPSSAHPLQLQFSAQFKQNDLRVFSAFPVFVWTLLFHPMLSIIVLSLHRNPHQMRPCIHFHLPPLSGGRRRSRSRSLSSEMRLERAAFRCVTKVWVSADQSWGLESPKGDTCGPEKPGILHQGSRTGLGVGEGEFEEERDRKGRGRTDGEHV